MDALVYIIAFIVWATLVFLTVRTSQAKNRSPVLWGIFALFVPLIALIIVLLLPKSEG